MADPKKNSPLQFVTQIESVRLTNWSIRTLWKSTALAIALTVRLFASIILTIVHLVRRHRYNG